MIDLSLTQYYAPLLILLISFLIIFAALTKLKIGGTSWSNAILSLLLSFIIVSSESVVDYMVDVLPVLTVLVTIGFVFTIILVFLDYEKSPFKKIMAWIGFVLAILIVLCIAFNNFPTLAHLLPSSSDAGLNSGLRAVKHQVYTEDFRDFLIFLVSIVVVATIMVAKKAS